MKTDNGWGTRGLPDPKWIKAYQITAPHRRSYFTELVSSCYPTSVLEIGCDSGSNLHFMVEAMPQATLYGIEANECAVEEAKIYCPSATVLERDITKSWGLGGIGFDVVCCMATLMCISPDSIDFVIDEMLKHARKELVFIEDYTSGTESNHTHGELYTYKYNYMERFKDYEIWESDLDERFGAKYHTMKLFRVMLPQRAEVVKKGYSLSQLP